jgi:hypothetical protein
VASSICQNNIEIRIEVTRIERVKSGRENLPRPCITTYKGPHRPFVGFKT